MADPIVGKLSFKNNKWQIIFFDEKKKKDSTLFPALTTIAPDLLAKKEEESEVHFERDNSPDKKAIQVRRKDTKWQGNAPAPQANQGNAGQNPPPLPGDFHNPYNFVPAPPRAMMGELGDCEPSGHDCYHTDKFSGKLSVTMTVETPLLLLDTAGVSIDDKHKNYPVRLENGLPCINPTAVKGMLRSAYEAVTNSRLSVFHEHDERLAFRMESTEGIRSIPARIEKNPVSNELEVVLYMGTSTITSDGTPQKDARPAYGKNSKATMYAAWLRRYKRDHRNPLPLPSGTHGEKVWAYITRWEHYRFDFWNVVATQSYTPTPPTSIPSDNRNQWRNANSSSTPGGRWVEGYICQTNDNIGNKHDERLFFNGGKRISFSLDNHKTAWKELIKNYRTEHESAPGVLKPPAAGVKWSQHILNAPASYQIQAGDLCYARVKQDARGWLLEEIIPVMISRRLHQVAPKKLLPSQLHPAYKLPELSPADRVFGWVRQADAEKDKTLSSDEKNKSAAYRGQLRVGAVKCLAEKKEDAIETFATPLPLQILGQPKPQQGRFYVAQNQQGEAQGRGLTNEQAGYQSTKGLRGRKVYPHHNVPETYWGTSQNNAINYNEKSYHREYRRPQNIQDNQNRSIEGWVKRNTKFTFDLHFINLSKVELGGLIWLLQLDENHFHRFGGGKPLGFGSVQLKLEGSEIIRGEEIKARYASLDGEAVGTTTAKDCRTAFEDEVNAAYPEANFLAAFKQAAQGFTKPVHYPRLDPHPNSEGKNFEWFVANNSAYGFKLTLPNLTNENGLPLMPKN